jgi:hypothetical protein
MHRLQWSHRYDLRCRNRLRGQSCAAVYRKGVDHLQDAGERDRRTPGHLFRLARHGVYGHTRRVVARQPDEGTAPLADMSETREGNMRGADPVSSLRRIGEYALAVHLGLILVTVVFDGHGEIRKLDSCDVNHISPDEQLLSSALDRV